MAESNNINFMPLIAPEFAAKQLYLQQQQKLADQLMQEGEQHDDPYHLANPGGLVVPISPLGAGAKALEKGLGGYMSGKAMADQLEAYKSLGSSLNPQSAALGNGLDGTNAPTMRDIIYGQMAPEWEKAHLALQNAGPVKAAETKNTPYVTPQGTYVMGDQLMGGGSQSAPAQPPMQQQLPPPNPSATPPAPAAPANDLQNSKDALSVFAPDASAVSPQGKGGPVALSGDVPAAPIAADGKPLLPNLTNMAAPDPSGTPKFKTENTKTGVEQTIQDQKDAAEGNKAFAATAQSLGQEKSRLDNLIQVYKDVQSGTLTAQNPEFFNKMAALGFKDDPQSIKNLAGIQNATQNHILQIIQQIKDTNANAGGGAPTRTFGSEISQLLENGESAKGQPEALWNVIGQAKGVVDHHLDMVNGWQKAGGLGNRLAGGYTMRPDDFASQFSTSHNIADYRDKALKEIGPFKGMAGNNGEAGPSTKTIDGVTYTKINGVWHK